MIILLQAKKDDFVDDYPEKNVNNKNMGENLNPPNQLSILCEQNYN